MSHDCATTRCPICGGTGGDQLAAYDTCDAAQAFVPRRLDPERHAALARKLFLLWHGARCTLRRCDSCDLIYADPFVSGDAEFYRLAYFHASYPEQKWEYNRTRQALRERHLSRPRVLEIGAGTGAFLRQMLDEGCAPTSLQAFEFSESGRAAIERLGISCLAADLRIVDFDQTFDIVCMFQVLEHLDDFDGVFKALTRIVRPGGHVFIATPNAAWISLNEARRLLLDMPPNHISRWSPASFAALARRFGWQLAACELEPVSRTRNAVRMFSDRYVRLVTEESRWESRAAELAMRADSRAVARLIKAGAALTSPGCLSAALRATVVPAISPNIWTHLIRPGEA